MKKICSGFTLIELMIVVVIVAILAAIAIPSYSKYVNRAKIADGLVLAGSAKTAITEYATLNNGLSSLSAADNNATLHLSKPSAISSNNVSRITVIKSGVILIQMTGTLGSFTLTPTVSDDRVSWHCAPASNKGTDKKYLPRACQPVALETESANETDDSTDAS